jgi:hypothetical protein
MADLFLGRTFSKKFRFIADSVAHTISDLGFRPDYVMVRRIDSSFDTDGNVAKSEWYRDMANGDALRELVQDCATAGFTHNFETTDGISLTVNAAGVDVSMSAVGAITGASAADPVVITDAAHGLSDGDIVRITNVGGMVELNNRRFRVNNSAANTFELQDPENRVNVDGSNFTAYTSGGQWNLLNREDANRDVYDAETYDVVLGTAVLTNDIEHVCICLKFGDVEDLGDVG